jgi:DNA-binding NtrC family response regulator
MQRRPIRAYPAERGDAAEGPRRTESGTRPAMRLPVEKPAASVLPALTIDVLRDPGGPERRVVHQGGDLFRIGTQSSNDLVLKDPAVSRFHCKLTRDGTAWRLTDSGSLNGTRLDGVRVRDADLGMEGTITIGDSILLVRASNVTAEPPVPEIQSFGALTGTSVAMRKLFAFLGKVAASEINVLIEGESGTGKELVAAEIVQRGPRAEGPFVIVDCSAISPSLVESELFGHVRGAFTGADRERLGAFEAANGGTVFLDEVGELPLEVQPKLLRALESREIRRVGETRSRKVDVRVIAATNRDLQREVNKGLFREDLYFRLAVMDVRVPPLRSRLDDIPLLVRGFLSALGMADQQDLFPARVLAELTVHDWPGNVRELRNYVERTIVLREPQPPSSRPGASVDAIDPVTPFKLAKDVVVNSFERSYVTALLEASGGNVSKAARAGGMDRMYLHRLIQKHGLCAGAGQPPEP